MQVELRDQYRRRVGRATIDAEARPTRAPVEGTDREVFLNWDSAQDDAGHLRRCITCGCQDLFREKAFPQVTGFVVVLAFAGAAVGLLGLAERPPVLTAMIVVLVLDVAILLFSRQRLVCYRCRTTFRRLPIARYHRRWDRAVAERYPAETPPEAPPPAGSASTPPA